MAKLKTFTVYADLKLTVGTEIKAEDLVSAAEQAKKLTTDDFVTIEGEYLDGSLRATGVQEHSA